MDFLVQNDMLHIAREGNGSFTLNGLNCALRNVRRLLVDLGFQRGKGKRVQIREHHIAWLNRHLRALHKNSVLPDEERLRLVFTDESYIHQHYARLEDSVFDPNDPLYEEPKPKRKGRRYCILAAIQEQTKMSPAGLVPGSVWTFCPQQKNAHTGDYHKNFNSENFVRWFKEQLIPNLSEPSMIILDNASYHKSKPASTPNPSTMRKQEVIEKLKEYKIPFEDGLSAAQAKLILREWIYFNVPCEIKQIAEDNGHRILFTPPHYSDIQPIELLWAFVKGNVGRKYSSSTTLCDVKARLDQEFAWLMTTDGSELVNKLILHVEQRVSLLRSQMNADEETENSGTNLVQDEDRTDDESTEVDSEVDE